MYKHILVAIAFDDAHDPETSLQVAQVLAGEETQVTVLHVKEQIPSYAIAYVPQEYEQGLKDAIRNQLSVLAQRFKHGHAELVEGHSSRTILDWADAHAVDCIVIGSHRPEMRDYLLGSTASKVVRHAQCSVHVMR